MPRAPVPHYREPDRGSAPDPTLPQSSRELSARPELEGQSTFMARRVNLRGVNDSLERGPTKAAVEGGAGRMLLASAGFG
jgi:hypothetical protein